MRQTSDWVLDILFGVMCALILLLGFVLTMANLAHASDVAVGDSIGLGTGHALGVSTYGRTGAGSCEIVRRVPRATYDHAVISAGINDGGVCVRAVRARVHAQSVVWILPAPINSGRAAVLAAVLPGDETVSYACRGGCTKSNFHPASYAVVASAVRSAWGSAWSSRPTSNNSIQPQVDGNPKTPKASKPSWLQTWIAPWRTHFGR